MRILRPRAVAGRGNVRRDRELIAQLQKIPLLSACSRDELAQIAAAATTLTYPAGTVLAREGELGCEFMLITAGTVEVAIRGNVVNQLGPDEFFGEVALLDGGPRTATVSTTSEVTAHVIEQREFSVLLFDSPSLARKLLVAVAKRLRKADLRLDDLDGSSSASSSTPE